AHKRNRIRCLPHVVNAKDGSAVEQRHGVQTGCAIECVVGRCHERAPDHRLPRKSHQNRFTQYAQLTKSREQLEVLVNGFRKTETGIYNDILDSKLMERGDLLVEV